MGGSAESRGLRQGDQTRDKDEANKARGARRVANTQIRGRDRLGKMRGKKDRRQGKGQGRWGKTREGCMSNDARETDDEAMTGSMEHMAKQRTRQKQETMGQGHAKEHQQIT